MLKNIGFIVAIVLCPILSGLAQIPQLIHYQAVITDTNGVALNGTYSIQFSFYDNETAGTQLWNETRDVEISQGLVSVLLGSLAPIPFACFNGNEVYLEVQVGSDPALAPRKRVVSVAYAFHAGQADAVGGHSAAAFVRSVDGVNPNGSGNVDLVAGANVTITPDVASKQITIAASGGGSGDNLGNHTATQNIRLGTNWFSSDGGNEGIQVAASGDVLVSGSVTCHGIASFVGNIQSNADIIAIQDLQANGGSIRTGSPSVEYGPGDIVATDEIVADNAVRTGSPTIHAVGSGDIAATDDLICDDQAYIGGDLRVWNYAGINAGGGINTNYPLYVYGDAYCTGSWLGSDLKFKKNISGIENPTALLMKLNGVSFNWRTDEFKERAFSQGRHLGFVAQDVEQVLPDLVKTDENGEKAVTYVEMIPLLVEALKQQQQTIEELQSKIEQLLNK